MLSDDTEVSQEDARDEKLDASVGVVDEDEEDLLGTSTRLDQESVTNICELSINFNDPGSWPKTFSDHERSYITKMRLEHPHEPNITKSNREGRSLTKDWFFKTLTNGTKIKRSWLGYSESNNALYCVPCRLFSYLIPQSAQSQISALAKEEGFFKWKKLSDKLPEHENSSYHKMCFCSWKSLESSLELGGIDKELQDQIMQEESHWRAVLHCILDAILFLAKQGNPFRGTKEFCDFSDPHSGQFLNTIDLLSHYSIPLKQHIDRHKRGQVTYFSHKIQDEFLEIIGNKIRQTIIEEVLEAKYFSLMFDCTPDISHNEQMTQIVRYVKSNSSEVEVIESFVDFFVVTDKTGEGLSQDILKKIEKDGLNIQNCRGQSYDNGANMAGKYKGVQSRLLQENNLAYFVPCAAHSLNLVGAHAADANTDARNYFGTLHSVYAFFVSSTSRWDILKKHVPLTLKAMSKTRWSARFESVEVVYKHYDKIIQALDELTSHHLSTPETKSEATALLKNLKKLEFIAFSCFWYALLKKINKVNQILQQEDLTVDQAARNIEGLLNLMKSCRNYSSSEAITEAKLIADMNGVLMEFSEKRKRKKKKMPDEMCDDEISDSHVEELFRMSLLEVIDRFTMELSTRFEALENINEKFGFLSGVQMYEMEVKDLKSKSAALASIYNRDLDKEEFMFEVESFKSHAIAVDQDFKDATPLSMLTLIYKHKLREAYPNITTALTIFLTIPVSVASGERSFSKLKLIKSYLRSTMRQERLTNLSIISIEHKRAALINYDEIINIFASNKSRKIKLRS